MAKQDIRTLTSSELKEAVVGLGEKAFRAKQIEEWLWTKGAASFEEMSNLSKGLRERLDVAFELNRIEVADQQFSSDGTIKCAFDVRAGQVVEGVDPDVQAHDSVHFFPGRMQLGVQVLRNGSAQVAQKPERWRDLRPG